MIIHKKIKLTKNGPLIVKGNIPLISEEIVADADGISCEWKETKKFEDKESYSLCRCGNSQNKPYCDGSHVSCNFQSNDKPETDKYADKAEEFTGPKQTMLDNISLCASARFCDRAGQAWNLINEEDKDSQNILYEEVCACSSGRLVLKNNKTGKILEPKLEKVISVTEDPPAEVSGPYWVKGGIPIDSSQGNEYEIRNRVTLCRCGKSSNMPFCDTSHRSSNFQA